MVKHGQKWSKMVTNDKNGKKNGQKWSKVVKNCQKLSKMAKISNNSQIIFFFCVGHIAWASEGHEGRSRAGLKGSKPARPSVVPSSGPGVHPVVCPVRNWGTAGPQTSSWLYLSKNNLVISNVNLYSALLSSIKSKFCIEWNLHSSMNYIQGSDR